MAQIISITSEALQATIRRLLPSQQGFGEDLQASNVITPVIDLTRQAEGSQVPENLQFALSLDSQTTFNASNSSVTAIATPGFWRVVGNYVISDNAAGVGARLTLNNALTAKNIYNWERESNGGGMSGVYDFVIFLNPGESLSAVSNDSSAKLEGSVRQVATTTGTLVNPAGFTPQ